MKQKAKQQGYLVMVAETLRENEALKALASGFGFTSSAGDDVGLIHLTLRLT